MAKIASLEFVGESGTSYPFDVYDLDTEWPRSGAVYIFSCRVVSENGGFSHSVKYIGESGDVGERFSSHEK